MHAVEVGAWWILAFSHGLAPVTIAIFALRFVGPRPELSLVARQPGTAACAAVTLATVTDILSKINYAAYWYYSGPERVDFFTYVSVVLLGSTEFVAVATAWSLLLACRVWSWVPDWIERSGCVLGVFWLLMPPLTLFVEALAALVRYFTR